MLAIVLEKGDDKLLGALALQKSKDFTVYLPESDPAEADYESQLHFKHGDWRRSEETLVCMLEPGAQPDTCFVKRILRTARRHPDFDVYHVNPVGAKVFPRKAHPKDIFKLTLLENTPAPLSSFVFRSPRLREKAVFKADGKLDVIPTVIRCAQERPVRNVWRQQLTWNAPASTQDPAAQQSAILEKLDLFRWTEQFFGDDDYPLSVGDQLDLFAKEVAALYPNYTVEELKETMNGFQVAQGPVRKLRAANALKAALKERQKALSEVTAPAAEK